MNHILAKRIGKEPVRGIIVVDERPIFRTGLAAAIAVIHPNPEVIEVSDMQSFDPSKEAAPAIVFWGIDRLSGSEIKEQIARLKPDKPSCKLILYDFGGSVEMISEYFGLGVDGFLTRFFDNNELERCLKAVLADKKYLSDDILSSIFGTNHQQKTKEWPRLSKTEHIVARHLIIGKKVSWIANTLDKRLSTISTIKSNIFKKMGVSNIIDLQRVLSDADPHYNH